MAERKGAVTFQGNPLTLVGDELAVGDRLPDVELLANDLTPVKLSSYCGKVCVIASVPSLDTPVCDTETRRFNQEAGRLGPPDVSVLTVSMDLPFAQKRWCGAAGVTNLRVLSDYRDASFGRAYGVLIKDLRLLSRTIFIVDKERKVRYVQAVQELTNEPDYNQVLEALSGLKGA